MLLFKGIGKYSLPVLVMLYFNATHCVYMAFDRYAFPMIPLFRRKGHTVKADVTFSYFIQLVKVNR